MHIQWSICYILTSPLVYFSSGGGLSQRRDVCVCVCALWFIGERLCVVAESATVLQCQQLIFITTCCSLLATGTEERNERNRKAENERVFLYLQKWWSDYLWVCMFVYKRNKAREREGMQTLLPDYDLGLMHCFWYKTNMYFYCNYNLSMYESCFIEHNSTFTWLYTQRQTYTKGTVYNIQSI